MYKQYYLYIITNKRDTTFYIGVTNNLKRRAYEHKGKLVPGFTKKYDLCKLVYYEITTPSLLCTHLLSPLLSRLGSQ
ncbi:GIY-YIG nuclease family protein [candidate division WOR-3 bacterium]|nr:GIY-YIG nuclease family protein [candidate division WOR-3 bacterium]